LLPHGLRRSGRTTRNRRLRRRGDGGRRARQPGRHPVPPGEEPGQRSEADREFPEMDSLMRAPKPTVEHTTELSDTDLHDLCEATDMAVLDGGGFGWLKPPPRHRLESYWRGVLLVPERELFLARLDGVACGSAQLVKPPRNNEAQRFAATLQHSFVAPWARGHGLARMLVKAVEQRARSEHFRILNLDVRETQTVAIKLYESLGYVKWGTHPHYARVRGRDVQGHFFYKELTKKKTQDEP